MTRAVFLGVSKTVAYYMNAPLNWTLCAALYGSWMAELMDGLLFEEHHCSRAWAYSVRNNT